MIVKQIESHVESNVELSRFKLHDNLTEEFLIQGIINLYVNKHGSIVREICSNCADTEQPFTSGIQGDQIFFRDHGEGMSPDFMKSEYLKVGYSTKSDDPNKIGGFGYGRLSILSYTNRYFIETVHEGKSYKYMVEYDNIPKLALLEVKDTDLKGTLIYFNHKDDINLWERAFWQHGSYFKKNIITKNNSFVPYAERITDLVINGVTLLMNKNSDLNGIVYGECFYPSIYTKNKSKISSCQYHGLSIHIPLDDNVEVLRSREGFNTNDYLTNLIEIKIGALNDVKPLLREGLELYDFQRAYTKGNFFIEGTQSLQMTFYKIPEYDWMLISLKNLYYSVGSDIWQREYCVYDLEKRRNGIKHILEKYNIIKRIYTDPLLEETQKYEKFYEQYESQTLKLSALIVEEEKDKPPKVKTVRESVPKPKRVLKYYRKALKGDNYYVAEWDDLENVVKKSFIVYGRINDKMWQVAEKISKNSNLTLLWVFQESITKLGKETIEKQIGKKLINMDEIKNTKFFYEIYRKTRIGELTRSNSWSTHFRDGVDKILEKCKMLDKDYIKETLNYPVTSKHPSDFYCYVIENGKERGFDKTIQMELDTLSLVYKYMPAKILDNLSDTSIRDTYVQFAASEIRKGILKLKIKLQAHEEIEPESDNIDKEQLNSQL